jgi:hypothetical protein
MQRDAAIPAVALVQASGRSNVMCTRHLTLRNTEKYTRPHSAHVYGEVASAVRPVGPSMRVNSKHSGGTTRRSADASCSRCCA